VFCTSTFPSSGSDRRSPRLGPARFSILVIWATHGGVKWGREKHIKAVGPGWHLDWPLTTEVEVVVTARQTPAFPIRSWQRRTGRRWSSKPRGL
jgi:hypothetical protein